MTPEEAGLEKLTEIGDLWSITPAGERVAEARRRGPLLRERLLGSGFASALRTLPLADFPWPGEFAFFQTGIYRPVVLRHRMNVVQFLQRGRLRTLVMNPTDTERSRQTPYFRRLEKSALAPLLGSALLSARTSVDDRLLEIGLRPGDVDYVSYDHLHTQDLRGAMGTAEIEPLFPRALFLIPRAEADILRNLHPLQRDWFIPEALSGVPRDRLVLLDGDYLLGDGVALLRTPGHTAGNHTLLVNTRRGIHAVSENGTAPECYVPERSAIAALRRYERETRSEVVLNGNTLEGTLDQYTSMVLEKRVVDWSDGFPNVLSSSPFVPSWLTPGMQPTYVLEPPEVGSVVARRAENEAA